jgi:DNA primase
MRRAQPLSEFLYARLAAGLDVTTLDGRARLASKAKPMLAQLPPGPFRELMQQRLTELTGVAAGSAPRRPPPSPERRTAMGTIPPDRRAIALLLRQPAVARHPDLPPGWRDAPLPEVGLLGQLVDLAAARPDIPPAALIDRWEDPQVRQHLNAVQALRLDLIEDDIPEHFVGALRRLAELARRAEVERLLRKNDLSSLTDDEKARLREIWRDRQTADETGI